MLRASDKIRVILSEAKDLLVDSSPARGGIRMTLLFEVIRIHL